MGKAEKHALERCPVVDDIQKENRNQIRRNIFCEGYRQAEKDLALTWEDMMMIHKYIKYAMTKVLDPMDTIEGKQAVYQEVLKRFNEQRG